MMKNIDTTPAPAQADDARAESISALADGALTGPEADAALAAAARPEGQARWQLYHLIGDTLRAPDLAARHDAALLAGVRAAMRQPEVTPEPAQPHAARRPEAANDGVFRWKLVSGFASVVAVAAIGWNVWGWAGAPVTQQLARATSSQAVQRAAPGVQRLALRVDSDQAQMLRDPRLDQLLAAHRRMAGLGGDTATFLRNATFEEPRR